MKATQSTDHSNSGFTLIELLVVVALIGLVTLFALPSVTGYFKVSLNSSARELASVIRETYNSTLMSGKVHRLVYDLKENKFWVEIGPATLLLDTTESKERDERRKKWASSGDLKKIEEEEKKSAKSFQLQKLVTRKEISLPRGVTFEDVVTEQSPDPIKEGSAYTHFFPHGITEQTIIHLTDGSNHHMTLIISSLIGRTRLVERYLSREEAFAL